MTFSRLSLLREDRCSGASLVSPLASLSAVATTFDCHLVQCDAGIHPLDALGTSDQQRRLRAAVADQTATVQVVTPADSVCLEFPDWADVAVRTAAEPAMVAVLMSRRAIDSTVALDWVHIELQDDEDQTQWIAATLEAAADLAVCEGGPLIVTAINGEVADHGRFESLLWEGSIRVPLWIREGATGCGRVNQPSGSFDVLETVLSSLNARAESESADESINLRLIRGGSSKLPLRSIRISHQDCEAVRTPDFLFVRAQSEEFGEKVALYGKPHDVWNVHDLSHEFPDAVDELSAWLLNKSH